MSAASCLRSEDKFLCSICLDVFTDPVTTPCGHNFCKNCINVHWNSDDQYLCPMCNEMFNTRPELHINTLLSEMVPQFRQVAQQKASSSSSEQQAAKPGEVPCDVCTGTKLKALKSCLVLLVFLVIPVCLAFIHYWTEVGVCPSYEGTVVKAVAQLEDTLSKHKKKLFEVELKRIQQYAVDVTLDPDTAHPRLILSDDGKQVKLGDVWKNLPDNPERFVPCVSVLGQQSLSSGRFYFEVQVKGKTAWDLGVARESIERKGQLTLGLKYGYWTIWLTNGNEYGACANHLVRLSPESQLQKVGVFVDYEEGLVSFYDVDAAALIFSFTGCSFTEKLYPFFNPGPNYGGINSAPLIICPVNQTV